MDGRENTPFVVDFKKYGSATCINTPPNTPSVMYCLHGHEDHVELRGHCHRQRMEGVDVKARKKLIIASILCLFFMVAEIIGGVLSNSLAIATDAAHLLTDFASFMISLFAIWLAGRPSTQRMSFGWYRAEVIGAMASVVMIWVITAILVWLAINRLISGEFEVDAKIMLITSVLAIIVNVIMGFQLAHSHSHGGGGSAAAHTHSHSEIHPHSIGTKRSTTVATTQTSDTSSRTTLPETRARYDNNNTLSEAPAEETPTSGHILAETNLNTNRKTYSYQNSNGTAELSSQKQSAPMAVKEPENINVRAAFIHVLGDVLQSIGVFIAALVIFFKPEWSIADPICTFVFSIIVLCTTFAIMKEALLVLMEGTPDFMEYTEVMEVFLNIEGVERVHNLRIWALSLNKIALSAHLAIAPDANPKKILDQATTAVHRKYNFFETTIQIEDFMPEMENCQQCTLPVS